MSDPRPTDDQRPPRPEEIEPHVRAVREGHGANCSSIGSVIDTLFVAQVAAGAVLAAVAAALASDSDSASDSASASDSDSASASDSDSDSDREAP